MVFDRLNPAVLFRHSPQVQHRYCTFGARTKEKIARISGRMGGIGKFLLNGGPAEGEACRENCIAFDPSRALAVLG
jgi:hypothetical protein